MVASQAKKNKIRDKITNVTNKKIKVIFCEEMLMISEDDLPRYQAKAEELYQLAIRAGYTEEQAKSEYYLKILQDTEA